MAAADPAGGNQRSGGVLDAQEPGQPPGGKQWVYCYKAHPLCDAETGRPVAVAVTTGSRNDSPLLPKLIDQAPADYAWFGPAVCVGDRGYDAGSNYALLLERNIAPVLRKRDLKPGKLYYGVYADDGVPACSDGTPLVMSAPMRIPVAMSIGCPRIA